MEPGNEINICKFYIKKCCKHRLRGNNWNYPHHAPCKKYIENSENGCRLECTSYHPDICKYSMKLRKCYNVNCYRIHLNGIPTRTTSCTHTRKQTNFITPTTMQTQPLKTNLTKPPVPLTHITLSGLLLIYTLIPITKFFPTLSLTSELPTQAPSNASSPRQNFSMQHTTDQS